MNVRTHSSGILSGSIVLLLAAGCSPLTERPSPAPVTEPEPPTVIGAQGKLSADEAARAIAALVDESSADADGLPSAIARIEASSDTPLYSDNAVTLLVDGPPTYQNMLAAIRRAEHHIHLETYIFSDDEVGVAFAEALTERSNSGIEVRIIYDSMGSRDSADHFFERIEQSGVELIEYHPINPVDGGNPLNVNNRDHRKLLIVDGRVAFTGGININRAYSSSSHPSSSSGSNGWRDTHLRVRGPAVAEFQRIFFENWREHGGRSPDEQDAYFPEPVASGDSLVRVLIAEGGEGRYSNIRTAYLTAMEAAQSRIWITQAYFAPDAEFLDVLENAARRGVDVRIIVPGRSDTAAVLYASRAKYGDLLDAGIHIFETTDAMLHAKSAVIDGLWSTVGSSNLDHRSFLHNDEVNAIVLGRKFGHQMELQFEIDQDRSRPITLEQWRERPFTDRFKEFFGELIEYWL